MENCILVEIAHILVSLSKVEDDRRANDKNLANSFFTQRVELVVERNKVLRIAEEE